ncbi:MAG: hypothetical protein AAFX85_06485, partial [Pseudomonadota bacterium]
PFYLASARASSDHHTGFSQLFRVAGTLADSAPEQGLAIADQLYELRPDIPAVGELRRRLQQVAGRSAAIEDNDAHPSGGAP